MARWAGPEALKLVRQETVELLHELLQNDPEVAAWLRAADSAVRLGGQGQPPKGEHILLHIGPVFPGVADGWKQATLQSIRLVRLQGDQETTLATRHVRAFLIPSLRKLATSLGITVLYSKRPQEQETGHARPDSHR